MAGNTGVLKGAGISYAPTEKQMAAYDALPPVIREALANAAFSWAPHPIYQRLRVIARGRVREGDRPVGPQPDCQGPQAGLGH